MGDRCGVCGGTGWRPVRTVEGLEIGKRRCQCRGELRFDGDRARGNVYVSAGDEPEGVQGAQLARGGVAR